MKEMRREEGQGETGRTLAILARKNERIKNLNLSSSVCMMMRLKFADGSMVPVMSSTVSIYLSKSCWSVYFLFLLLAK